MLITARARNDPQFRDALFVSLRRYDLDDDQEAEASAEVADVGAAVDVVRGWLEELSS